ncbi:P-loop containing nucleoside triphosphate hydrolase protein [Zopfia rhizophila CBS 207.26]|uniref:P-loop containing nucleoside triphosphate hydrolase protein n=1 Tax=Zopfia rhizophila CBS 207.26 TaxID=1314779 RepID=A0A6A6DS69_9PEZI|nr:P-loop containing nucleoside triphosphate hydrolase protein [Zopfia rhizophila CBS 207.26]
MSAPLENVRQRNDEASSCKSLHQFRHRHPRLRTAVFVVTLLTTLRFLWSQCRTVGLNYVMSSIHFDERDEMFTTILNWLAEQDVGKSATKLKAAKRIEKPEEDDGFDASELFHAIMSYYLARIAFGEDVAARYEDEENLALKTLGWSTKPIKELLKSKTIVWSPQSRGIRPFQIWRRVASRPTRHINTVVLDAQQKAKVIADMNEYLQPRSYRWYASRGIPYRQGYLFHGPPGTGKSSLSFALAGSFGLDVYIISLLDPHISECVVLIEDIDSAGLERDQVSSKDIKNGGGRSFSGYRESSITLTDKEFLNAIDGVASQEGRILVVTTNFPERLAPALLRPGRIDTQIAFTLAKKDQMREMMPQSQKQVTYDISELKKLAEQFAGAIEEDTFSPAEIQNFLISKRKDPRQAVQDVDAWKCGVLKARKSGPNVVTEK